MKRYLIVAAVVAVAAALGGSAWAQKMDASMEREIDLERARPMELQIDGSFNTGNVKDVSVIVRAGYADGSSMRFYSDSSRGQNFLMMDQDLEVFIVDRMRPTISVLVKDASGLRSDSFEWDGEYRLFSVNRRGARKLVKSGVISKGQGINLPDKPYGRLRLEIDANLLEVPAELNLREGVDRRIRGQ